MRASRLVLALSLVAFAGAPALAGDIIVQTNGKPLGNPRAQVPPKPSDYADSSFTLWEENLDTVTYRLRGVPQLQSIKAETVLDFYHDPSTSPTEMARALEAERQGDYATAREMWDRAADSSIPWAQAMGSFRSASTYWSEGNAAEATKALAVFMQKFPKSWYRPQAIQITARALMAQNKVKEAREAFESIKSLPGVSDTGKNEADYWVTWIDERLAKAKNDEAGLKKAMNEYKALKTKLSGSRDANAVALAMKCALGVASCQIQLGDLEAAKTDLTRLITAATADDKFVLAGAHTLMGNALLKQNSKGQDRSLFKDALWHYLRVVCLYGTVDGAEDYHGEALYQAGQMFIELRPTDTSSEEAKDQKTRWTGYARNEWNECRRLYPGTFWAQESERAANTTR